LKGKPYKPKVISYWYFLNYLRKYT